MKICGPAEYPTVARTMAPDEQDHSSCPPDKMLTQWSHLFTQPNWQSVQFRSTDRNEMCGELGRFDFVVVTEAEESYGNLVLTVNPSDSEALASIPPLISNDLAGVLSACGHSQRLVLLPGSIIPSLLHSKRLMVVKATTDEMLSRITRLWLPDGHKQSPAGILQSPLAYCGRGVTLRELPPAWLGINAQIIDEASFLTMATCWKTAAVVRCSGSGSDNSYVIVNGCTVGM